MIDFIKSIDFSEEIKIDKLYHYFKSNSSKTDAEIYSKIRNFKKVSDFFQYYTNSEAIDYLCLLNKIKYISIKNNDEINSSSLYSNVEQYLSCLTRIFLSLKLLQKAQETMNKLLKFLKKILLELKNENKIENCYLADLFSYIECLTKTTKVNFFETLSKELSCKKSSLDSVSYFLLPDKFLNGGKLGKNNFDGASPTPKFKNDNENENEIEENMEIKNKTKKTRKSAKNYLLKKNSTFSFSEFEFHEKGNENLNNEIKKFESNIKSKNKKSKYENVINKTEKNLNGNNKAKKLSKNKLVDLLEMINFFYRKCLIKAEEKIKLKKLVMIKSQKLFDLYNNHYFNINIDEKIIIGEIKKIIE